MKKIILIVCLFNICNVCAMENESCNEPIESLVAKIAQLREKSTYLQYVETAHIQSIIESLTSSSIEVQPRKRSREISEHFDLELYDKNITGYIVLGGLGSAYKKYNYSKLEKKKFQCNENECAKILHSDQAIRDHINKDHYGRVYVCLLCSKKFKSNIVGHLKKEHSDQQELWNVRCNKCSELFTNRHGAEIHHCQVSARFQLREGKKSKKIKRAKRETGPNL